MPRDRLINIGFGNYVLAGRVVGIVSPASSPMKRLREDARAEGRLIDATQGAQNPLHSGNGFQPRNPLLHSAGDHQSTFCARGRNPMTRQGIALVLSAPSGAGKTTLVKRLQQEFPGFAYSVSCTTRPPPCG